MADYNVKVKIGGELASSFASSLKGAQSGLGALGTAGKVAGAAVKVTAAAMAAAGTAIMGVGAYSVKVGQQFETAMSSVAATSGATVDEVARMEEAARNVAKTSSKTASECANALEYMALAGWDVETSLAGLEPMIKMSEASGMDLARTSDLVTDSMSALGVGVDGMANYMDIATRAQNKSNQTAEQLMEAYLGVGGTLKNLNVPLEESGAALGVLANRGIKGSEAGNALNAIMINLTTGTGAAGKMMEKLGISAFDSAGNFIGLENTLQQVNKALANCTEEERNAALAALGGKLHVDALNDLMSGLNETNAEGVSEWQALQGALEDCDGALAQMAETKMDNLAGDLAKLQSAAEEFGIAIYQSGTGPLRGLVQYATDAVNGLSDAFAEGGFDGLAVALGDTFAQGLTKIAQNAPEMIAMAEKVIDSFITGLENNSGEIGEGASRIITALAGAFIRLTPRILVLGGTILAEIGKGLLNAIPELVSAAGEAIGTLFQAIKDAIKGYGDFLSDEDIPIYQKIISLIPGIVAAFLAFKKISSIAKNFKGFLDGFKTISKAGPGAAKGLKGADSALGKFGKNALAVGGSVLMIGAGLMLMSQAAIALSAAGPGAVVTMVLMMGAVAGLMVVVAQFGTKLATATPGLIAFGAALIMAGIAMNLMVLAAINLSNSGPGAAIAMALMVAGMVGIAIAAAVFAPALMAGGVALAVFGAGLLVVAAACVVASVGLAIVTACLPIIAEYGLQGALGIAALGASMMVMAAGAALLGGAGLLAAAGLAAFIIPAGLALLTIPALGDALYNCGWGMTQMATMATKAVSGMQAVQNKANQLKSAITSINLQSAGENIMNGLIRGLESKASVAIATAQRIARSISTAVNSALKIHSPSRVMMESGQNIDEGLALGMTQNQGTVQDAASGLATPVQSGVLQSGITAPAMGAGATNSSESVNITYSPTLNFQGGTPSKDDIVEAEGISQREFNKMIDNYFRDRGRTAFA